MNKFVNFLEKYLSTPMTKLSEQRHLRAIRDGVVSSLPFIIIGSMFLIVAMPPVAADSALGMWAAEHAGQILIPFRVTMFIMTLYVTFGIGYNLAQTYKLDPLTGGQLSIAALLMTIIPQATDAGWMLPMGNLGGQGLFIAMIVSIFAVEIQRFCKEKNITIKMPDSVPPSIARSFAALFPVGIVIVVIGFITVVLGIDLHGVVGQLVAPLISAGDSLPGVLLLVFLITFFWSFGVHGVSVIGAVARPIWQVYAEQNAAAASGGESLQNLPFIAPETFYQWFVWIGGAGATLGLVIATLIVARSNYMRAMGKATIVPSLFNINEPVMFGMPIVLNPLLIIPFIIIPLITTIISYVVTVTGLVNATFTIVPWTLPAPIGAFLATGGDWRAIILVLVNITISTVIYLPFIKIYDKKLVKQEQGEEVVA